MRDKYYHILEIPKNSGLKEIKRAYRRLAKKYHPDVSQEPNAEERFIDINEAYEYLMEASKYNDLIWSTEQREDARQQAKQDATTNYKAWAKSKKVAKGTLGIFVKMTYLFTGFMLSTVICMISFVLIMTQIESQSFFHVVVTILFFFIWIALAVFIAYRMNKSNRIREFFS